MSCYTSSRKPDVPMVYAWAKSPDEPISQWLWTDAPYAAYNAEGVISKDIRTRMISLGYQPIVHTNPGDDRVKFHTYAKINKYASLDRGCEYLEYIPNGDTYLGMGKHPSVMTIIGVFELEAKSDGQPIPEEDTRNEYIIGLEHLHGRINDADNPIAENAVLILTAHDTEISARSRVVQNAIDMGFNGHELAVLVDIMSDGRVVFDNERRSYTIDGIDSTRHGFFKYAGQRLLTANEFHELLGYEVKPAIPMTFVPEIYRACQMARNNSFMNKKDPMSAIPHHQLLRIH